MRSFVGVLLNAFISKHSVLLIDEPEAFLHPPQARLLAQLFAIDYQTPREGYFYANTEIIKPIISA
jgi:predicted ATPase